MRGFPTLPASHGKLLDADGHHDYDDYDKYDDDDDLIAVGGAQGPQLVGT